MWQLSDTVNSDCSDQQHPDYGSQRQHISTNVRKEVDIWILSSTGAVLRNRRTIFGVNAILHKNAGEPPKTSPCTLTMPSSSRSGAVFSIDFNQRSNFTRLYGCKCGVRNRHLVHSLTPDRKAHISPFKLTRKRLTLIVRAFIHVQKAKPAITTNRQGLTAQVETFSSASIISVR